MRLYASCAPATAPVGSSRSPGDAFPGGSPPDLSRPETGPAIEYDGEHHVDRRHVARDTARRDAMDAIGWRCVVLYQEDVGTMRPRAVRRWRGAFADQACVEPGRSDGGR
ncbi:hypothetical protein GCM10023221_18260 [Luteimicrobium xylanilyticum]